MPGAATLKERGMTKRTNSLAASPLAIKTFAGQGEERAKEVEMFRREPLAEGEPR